MRNYVLAAGVLVVTLAASPAWAQPGNGAPSGGHYNLNIIGVAADDAADCKRAEMEGSNRHTIFVDLDYSDATPTEPTGITELNRRNKIFLQEGSFRVIDGNACDGDEAIFQLPAQDCAVATVETVSDCAYDVYIRGLGAPGGRATVTTCGIDAGPDAVEGNEDDVFQCSLEPVDVSRERGKSSFRNVTRELTTLCIDTFDDAVFDGKCDERVVLFEDDFYQYFWDYDNFGLRLAQLRFYPNGD